MIFAGDESDHPMALSVLTRTPVVDDDVDVADDCVGNLNAIGAIIVLCSACSESDAWT